MDKMPDRGIDSYACYSCDQDKDFITSSEIGEAISEWYDGLTDEEANNLPQEVPVFCYDPISVDYDLDMQHYINSIEESIGDSYMHEDCPPFKFSKESKMKISAAIKEALNHDSFTPLLLNKKTTIWVNPSDYIPSHLLEGDINEP